MPFLSPGVATGHMTAWRSETVFVNNLVPNLPEPPRSPRGFGGPRTPGASPRAAKQQKRVEWGALVEQLSDAAGGSVGGFIANGAPPACLRRRNSRGPSSFCGAKRCGPALTLTPTPCFCPRAAMRGVDRSHFVPANMCLYAHLDMSVKLGRWKKAGAVEERELAPPSVHALCLSLLHAHLQPGSQVLDAGCGNGYLATTMARAVGPSGRVTAADTVKVMVESARECVTHCAPDLLETARLELIAVEDWETLRGFGPFDAIHLGPKLVKTGVPAALVEMLSPGGRLIAHVGGEVQRMVVIDKMHDESTTTRVLNKAWPPANRKSQGSHGKRHRSRPNAEPSAVGMPSEDASFDAADMSPQPPVQELSSTMLSELHAVASQGSQNLMFDRRVYRGSNYARPVETLADSDERNRGEAAKARAMAREELSQARLVAPKPRRVRPIAGVQTDHMNLLTPMTPPAHDRHMSIEDADGAAGVYLVSHLEQLAIELKSATVEGLRLKEQLEEERMRSVRLEQTVAEMRYAALYAAEQRSSSVIMAPQPAAVEAMRSQTELEKRESEDAKPETPAEDDEEQAAAAMEPEPVVAAAELEPKPVELLPHQQAATLFIDLWITESIEALVARNVSLVPTHIKSVAEFVDQLIEAAIKRRTSEPEPEPEQAPMNGSAATEVSAVAAAVSAQQLAADDDEESDTEEEEDDEDDDFQMDDSEDLKRLEAMTKRSAPGAGGAPAGRRMSLADMKAGGGANLQGMAKFRELLSEVEVQEYCDFFDIVDADSNGTIDGAELKQVMTMMGMDAPDDRIAAMIGEVTTEMEHEGLSKLEMDFNEFLALMAIFVGPRGDQQNAELETAFNVIDADGGGTIDMEELAEAFKIYGEKVTDDEMSGIMAIVDADGDGEVGVQEFKDIMLTAVKPDADERERTLRRKMRTTVRTLIMRQRFSSAIQAFDERYNFLRFSDAKIIAPDDQNIVRLHKDQTTFSALAAMRAENVACAPVYADEGLKEKPLGFLYMNDLIRLLLETMSQMFKPANDPVAIQLRLDRIGGDASTFSQTPISSLVKSDWKPIRPGYMVYNLGGVLATGVKQVPYCNDEGDLTYLITQESFLAAFNEDARVRLGGVAHITAMELGCIKPITKVPTTMSLAEAFKAADADPNGTAVVCDAETDKLVWSVGPETLNAHGLDTPDALGISLSKPISELYRDLVEVGVEFQRAITCTPKTSMRQLVKAAVESGANRLWVVDDDEKPIGVVLLSEIISRIMEREGEK